MVDQSQPSNEEVMSYWQEAGEKWSEATSQHPALSKIREGATKDFNRATRRQENGWHVDTSKISRQLPLEDGTQVDVEVLFDKGKMARAVFELPDGSAFKFEPGSMSFGKFAWSERIEPPDFEGDIAHHSFSIAGLTIEANRARVEEVLNDVSYAIDLDS